MFAGFKPIKPLLHVEADRQSDEERYWSRMSKVSAFQENGNISCAEFLPMYPYSLATTCLTRITMYDMDKCDETMSIYSRFKSTLHCLSFRADGNIAGVGTMNGQLHFFDVDRLKRRRALKHPVRSFNNAHNHRVNAITYDTSKLKFASMADDGAIKLWDLADPRGADAQPLWQMMDAHTDHIRSGTFSRQNDNMIVTGSYDHLIKVWDIRTADESNALMEMNHEKPVEKILLFPNDSIVISAGGNTIKLWDIASGGKLLHTIENHHKTVTSLCFATNSTYFMSGGLDKRINIYRCTSGDFGLVQSWKTDGQVLSLAMSANDQYMACGMPNLLSISRRKTEEELAVEAKNGGKKKESFFESESSGRKKRPLPKEQPLFVDPRVSEQKRRVAAPPVRQRERDNLEGTTVELTARLLDKMNSGLLDNLLRQRRYREFFSTTILKCGKDAQLAVAALQQLRIRQKLYLALSGHPEKVLLSTLKFLQKNLFKDLFFEILYDVLNVFFTIYTEEVLSAEVLEAVEKLNRQIFDEIYVERELAKMIGLVNMLAYRKPQITIDEDGAAQRQNNHIPNDDDPMNEENGVCDDKAGKMNGCVNSGISSTLIAGGKPIVVGEECMKHVNRVVWKF